MRKNRQTEFLSKKGQFKNPYSSGLKHGLFDILLWKAGFLKDKKTMKVPADFVYKYYQSKVDPNLPSAMWINHSSFLIQIDGMNILTDPIWSRKCSPFKTLGPSRLHKPPIKIKELPEIHYVIISHNHYDHLDKSTVKKLNKKFPNINWIVPKRLKKWFKRLKIINVHEFMWWEKKKFPKALITAVPAQHFSGRHLFDYNNTLWMGCVFQSLISNKKFYFFGDSGYNSHDFKRIGRHFNSIDLSLIPIGAYVPRAFTKNVHIDPYEALLVHKEVNSKKSIAMHWKTFKLSDEPMELPPYDLFLALKKANISEKEFLITQPGNNINW